MSTQSELMAAARERRSALQAKAYELGFRIKRCDDASAQELAFDLPPLMDLLCRDAETLSRLKANGEGDLAAFLSTHIDKRREFIRLLVEEVAIRTTEDAAIAATYRPL